MSSLSELLVAKFGISQAEAMEIIASNASTFVEGGKEAKDAQKQGVLDAQSRLMDALREIWEDHEAYEVIKASGASRLEVTIPIDVEVAYSMRPIGAGGFSRSPSKHTKIEIQDTNGSWDEWNSTKVKYITTFGTVEEAVKIEENTNYSRGLSDVIVKRTPGHRTVFGDGMVNKQGPPLAQDLKSD